MTILTIEQLRTVTTTDQALDSMLGELAALGFPTDSWQPGSVQRTLLTAVASQISALSSAIASLVDYGFNDTASGSALDLFSKSHYDNTRQPANPAGFILTLTNTTGSPVTIGAYAAVVKSPTTGYTYRSVNVAPWTIAASSTDLLTFVAEMPGAAPGAAGIGTITQWVTPQPGVTVTNLSVAALAGADAESDADLRSRNSARWGALNTIQTPSDGYRYGVLTAVPGIKRVAVVADGYGNASVYCAATSQPSGAADIILAQNWLDDHHSICTTATAIAAVTNTISIIATVYVDAAHGTAATLDAVEAAAQAYIDSMPIGGIRVGIAYLVPRSGIIAAMSAVPGVLSVSIANPAGDTVMASTEVAVADVTGISMVVM